MRSFNKAPGGNRRQSVVSLSDVYNNFLASILFIPAYHIGVAKRVQLDITTRVQWVCVLAATQIFLCAMILGGIS